MIAFAARVTRRTRRQLIVISTAAVMGIALPIWAPRLLSTLPAFHVREVTVVGTRHVPPDEIKRLAGITAEASVWDDPEVWEGLVRAHPMVRDATVRRHGFRSIEIVVVEKRPVALVATPELRAINGEGQLLPLEPFETGLDLPIINGVVETDGERVTDPAIRELAALLDRLYRASPEFVSIVSEASYAPDGGYRFSLLPGAEASVVLLPRKDPLRALDRVSIALGQIGDRRVQRADARFTGQVVLTRAEGR